MRVLQSLVSNTPGVSIIHGAVQALDQTDYINYVRLELRHSSENNVIFYEAFLFDLRHTVVLTCSLPDVPDG